MPANSIFINAVVVALVALLSSSSSSVAARPQTMANNFSASTQQQPSANLCGNDQRVILQGTPWLVANSMYGAGAMVGTSCTYFDHVEGNAEVVWSSTVHIQDVPGT